MEELIKEWIWGRFRKPEISSSFFIRLQLPKKVPPGFSPIFDFEDEHVLAELAGVVLKIAVRVDISESFAKHVFAAYGSEVVDAGRELERIFLDLNVHK